MIVCPPFPDTFDSGGVFLAADCDKWPNTRVPGGRAGFRFLWARPIGEVHIPPPAPMDLPLMALAVSVVSGIRLGVVEGRGLSVL
jgi:hypothetical protein